MSRTTSASVGDSCRYRRREPTGTGPSRNAPVKTPPSSSHKRLNTPNTYAGCASSATFQTRSPQAAGKAPLKEACALWPLLLKSALRPARQSSQRPSASCTSLETFNAAEGGSLSTLTVLLSRSGTKKKRNALKLSSSASGPTLYG